ncbi:Uncharacterised protein [Shigella sonnei]|nr:Uncharacterised protein [Shigella sonnei]
MRILIPQYRHVKAPLPVNKRFQQKLNHPFFIKMLVHYCCCLLASLCVRFTDRVDSRENLIMTAYVIVDRCDIDRHQFIDAIAGQCRKCHYRFTAHGVTDKCCFVDLLCIQSINKILRHRRVIHYRISR